MSTQTTTPLALMERPSKASLLKQFLNQPLDTLRTPALLIDRTLFAENCAKMHQRAKVWNAKFRAHLKTHKVNKNKDPYRAMANLLRRWRGQDSSYNRTSIAPMLS